MPSWSRHFKDAAKEYAVVRAALRVRAGVRSLTPFARAGHFYSPIPDLKEVRADAARIFAAPATLPGVELRAEQQLRLLTELGPLTADLPWQQQRVPGLRYCYDNGAFSYGDAAVYAAMLRKHRPKRVVEVGAGSSTALLLDVCDHFIAGVEIVTIEPYPALLESLLEAGDLDRMQILRTRLQDAPRAPFDALQDGDILFVDSSHVSKVGSDVNHLFFEILPRLTPGVIVHLHDVFYPFEYPRSWIEEGRAWNEAYLLRAFLAFNSAFEVLLYNAFLATHHPDALLSAIPTAAKDTGGSIWLRRT